MRPERLSLYSTAVHCDLKQTERKESIISHKLTVPALPPLKNQIDVGPPLVRLSAICGPQSQRRSSPTDTRLHTQKE